MTYRVALIGAGVRGSVHAHHWNALPGTEIVGVLDPRPKAAAAAGPSFDDWNTLLSLAQPDIIDICTPTPRHREYVEQGAAAGKAIFVEAPLARTAADCEAIIAAVERAGVPAMASHSQRYCPEYAAAKRMVDAGSVGQPSAIRTACLTNFPVITDRPNWHADPAHSGGVVLERLVHDFDWLRWTFGPILRVYAKGLSGRPEHRGYLDYALVTLRFDSGAVGHVTGSWAHPGGFRTTLEIAGDGGMIEHDSARSAPLTASLRTADDAVMLESPTVPQEDPCYQGMAAFVAALESGQPPPITLYEAYEAVRLSLAALESLETGRVVTLS